MNNTMAIQNEQEFSDKFIQLFLGTEKYSQYKSMQASIPASEIIKYQENLKQFIEDEQKKKSDIARGFADAFSFYFSDADIQEQQKSQRQQYGLVSTLDESITSISTYLDQKETLDLACRNALRVRTSYIDTYNPQD